jgi:6,7-dimethyl-8-ribityllumazine synthase
MEGLRIWVLCARDWHAHLAEVQVSRVMEALAAHDKAVPVRYDLPPGAGIYELPQEAARMLANTAQFPRPHAMIALGVVLQGGSKHDEDVAYAAAHGMLQLGLTHGIPVIWGVVHATTQLAATERTTGAMGAESAVSYARLAVNQAQRFSTRQ